MKKLLFAIAAALVLSSAAHASPDDWCKKNFKGSYGSEEECVEAEEASLARLKSRPINADILSSCGGLENEDASFTKVESCVKEAEEEKKKVSSNPFRAANSRAWYAKYFQKHFPSHVRVCGFETPKDRFSLLPEDITKFRVNTMVTAASAPVLSVEGLVQIGPIEEPFEVGVKEESGKREYEAFIDAFLISSDGKVQDVVTFPVNAPVSAAGGTFKFSFEIGKGWNFAKGATLLVTASGTPVEAPYPTEPCAVLGARAVSVKR